VILEDLKKSCLQRRDNLWARLPATTHPAEARLPEGLGVGQFPSALGKGLPVTGEDTGDITEATLAELTGFNGRIPTTIFFREAVVKRQHLFFDR
jgi:hypothetical protein